MQITEWKAQDVVYENTMRPIHKNFILFFTFCFGNPFE